MRRPFRKYCFMLAERLHKPLDEIMSMDVVDIMEWMAFDRTQNEDWQKSYERELQLEKSRQLTPQQRCNAFKAAFRRGK